MTITEIELLPTVSAVPGDAAPLATLAPLTVMVAAEFDAVGLIISNAVPFGTDAVYEIVAEANAGVNVPVSIWSPLSVASELRVGPVVLEPSPPQLLTASVAHTMAIADIVLRHRGGVLWSVFSSQFTKMPPLADLPLNMR